jgi:myo-inositol-1(or 4)-monophosphatase
MEIKQALETAIRAARRGGEIARARLGKPGYLQWKGLRDVTSEASLEVQAAIVSTLLADFPDSAVLAEEGPDDAPLPVGAEHLWIVDPICGSLNFVHGIPHFALSIALRTAGNIQLGVVYDPCRDELFQATSETPALRNGENIVVQQVSEGIEAWSAAMVGTDWPYAGARRKQAQTIVGIMLDQINGLSIAGSPALGLCNLAAGRLHAYWHLDLKIWDIAAASVILQRAGAILTDAHGDTWLYSDGGYVATNGVIHGWLLNCLRPFLGERRETT